MFEGSARLIEPNISFAKLGNIFHLFKVFLTILAFKIITGIFLSFKFLYILGQISESIKIANSGCQ